MPKIQTNCQICKDEIIIGSLNRFDCSVCVNCFNNRTLTKTQIEIEFTDIDKSLLTKLHYKNYLCYSVTEYDHYNNLDGLSLNDIHFLKESKKYFNKTDIFRKNMIKYICDRWKLNQINVLCDKYVDAFVTYGMHQFDTDEEFFSDVVVSFKE